MKKVVVFILLFACFSSAAQRINADFVLKRLPHNLWMLILNKDHTYKSIHWSPNFGTDNLDYGKYGIEKSKIVFVSSDPDTNYNYADSSYYLKIIHIKNTESFSCNCLYETNKNLFRTKITALMPDENYSGVIRSDEPEDNIYSSDLKPDTSLMQWVKSRLNPVYKTDTEQIYSAQFNCIFKSDKLEVDAVTNHYDLLEIYFQSDETVYSAGNQRSYIHQKAVIKFLHSKGIINRKEKLKIQRDIKDFMEVKNWYVKA